jgi:hypothetical protein
MPLALVALSCDEDQPLLSRASHLHYPAARDWQDFKTAKMSSGLSHYPDSTICMRLITPDH